MGEPPDFQSLTDEEILFACKSASAETVRKGIEILAKRHQTAIFNYINKIIRDREAAEDLTQEAFVRVFRKSREFKNIAKFATWLYKIATNLALNELRDRKSRASAVLNTPAESDSGEGDLLTMLPSPDAPPETEPQRRELAGAIQQALQEMQEKYRLILILCDMEGFSYQETAHILRTSSGTIGSRLSRARRIFIEKFKPFLDAAKNPK